MIHYFDDVRQEIAPALDRQLAFTLVEHRDGIRQLSLEWLGVCPLRSQSPPPYISTEGAASKREDRSGASSALLNRMRKKDSLDWAARVLDQAERQQLGGETAILLAGKSYREHVHWILLHHFGSVEVPMFGLTMGRQLSWLAERT